ncbi:serine/threonine-protein kinase [Saccharothrix sp. S26]|uniref:serine/threonine-protein kinase n=1 Tax=Saccharothrix sp. S26 TaxID=2907215 RepID=UPI002278E0E5|nr:serine/threonine-protein kinase [Saccharothrix sp. S26]
MSACARTGCGGTILPHGYCGTCGHKAGPAVSPPTTPPTNKPPTAPTSSTPESRGTTPGSVPNSGRRRTPLGGGSVELPPLPPRDPDSDTPSLVEVPETKRFCRECREPVGRGVDGEPGPTEGTCPNDGVRFSFAPALSRGTLVAERYEVLRCIARGGQGWIYLTRDRHLSDQETDHLVVLKGLIDSDDPVAIKQAIEERRRLLQVKHPNIVKISDFVQHRDPRTGKLDGYIVMEYVEGRSLQQVFLDYRDEEGRRAPLSLPVVLTFGSDVLLALDHLHSHDLLYCDFKPDNALYTTTGEIKLIDFGAVVDARNPGDVLFGTRGFAAPELDRRGPSVASDIHTVGRSLAVLSFPFAGFSREENLYNLPARDTVPLLAEHDSYYRLLRRATHTVPEKRFGSAEEMRGQLEGVLLEVLAAADGKPRLTVSTQFAVELRTFGAEDAENERDGVDWTRVPEALPAPLVDPTDESAAHLAAIAGSDPDDMIAALRAIPVQSTEVRLQLVAALIAAGRLDQARVDLDDCAEELPGDWRIAWYRGIHAMAAGRPEDAVREFDAVYDALPGELTPKLALAAAAECAGEDDRAGELYGRVWRTDNRYVSAAFGLARVLRRKGDLAAAVDALDRVPDTSSQHRNAQIAAIRTRLAAEPDKPDLLDAAARLTTLELGIEQRAALSARILDATLTWVASGNGHHDRSGQVLGRALEERDLRFGLEKAYRDLATVTDDPDDKVALVRQANRVRPRTLF